MSKMIAKLFNKIKLELEKQIENFKYELKSPKEIDKADMIDGLGEIMTVSQDLQNWLPDKVILQKFKLDRSTDPDTFVLAMEIDPPVALDLFDNILKLNTASFEIETNNEKIATVEEAV